MPQHAVHYARRSSRPLRGLVLLCPLLLLAACATHPESAVQPVLCRHPEIEPYTNEGLTLAVRAYGEALDTCNSLNGFPLED